MAPNSTCELWLSGERAPASFPGSGASAGGVLCAEGSDAENTAAVHRREGERADASCCAHSAHTPSCLSVSSLSLASLTTGDSESVQSGKRTPR